MYERHVAELTKSTKLVYVHNAGYKRKTKLFWMADNKILESERRNPNDLFDKDHVDLEGMRDRPAYNCFMTAMETQYGFVVQTENSDGKSIRKSMRSKSRPNPIDLTTDSKQSYDKANPITGGIIVLNDDELPVVQLENKKIIVDSHQQTPSNNRLNKRKMVSFMKVNLDKIK